MVGSGQTVPVTSHHLNTSVELLQQSAVEHLVNSRHRSSVFRFLPRDAMQARSLPSSSVCPSVRPSVTFVDHVKTNKHIFEIFSPSSSDTILVFSSQRGCRYSDTNPPNGGVECKGYDKITIFSQISHSISETVIVRWVHKARQFESIEFSFHPYNI